MDEFMRSTKQEPCPIDGQRISNALQPVINAQLPSKLAMGRMQPQRVQTYSVCTESINCTVPLR